MAASVSVFVAFVLPRGFMSWGSGPELGALAFSGQLLWLAAVALAWRHREDFLVWMEDEVSLFRRNFSRYVPVGPFYCRRGESRFTAIPVSLFHSAKHFPLRRANGVAVLILIGVLLLLLDFYI